MNPHAATIGHVLKGRRDRAEHDLPRLAVVNDGAAVPSHYDLRHQLWPTTSRLKKPDQLTPVAIVPDTSV